MNAIEFLNSKGFSWKKFWGINKVGPLIEEYSMLSADEAFKEIVQEFRYEISKLETSISKMEKEGWDQNKDYENEVITLRAFKGTLDIVISHYLIFKRKHEAK